jgi:hypothetical protein
MNQRRLGRAFLMGRRWWRRLDELGRSKPLVITHNQLALLQGLLDRPRGVARSRRDLARAALPYVKPYRQHHPSFWTLYHAADNLPGDWVACRRVGNRVEFRILPRARAILEGRVGPIRLRGFGPWVPRGAAAEGR